MRSAVLRAVPLLVGGFVRIWSVICPFSRSLKALEMRVAALESAHA